MGIQTCAAWRIVGLRVGRHVDDTTLVEVRVGARSVFRCLVKLAHRAWWRVLTRRHLSIYLSLSRCTLQHHQRLFDLLIELVLAFPGFYPHIAAVLLTAKGSG